jgi:hypothetical protein
MVEYDLAVVADPVDGVDVLLNAIPTSPTTVSVALTIPVIK